MNILIPLAGNGSRFINRGFKTPKPLIEIIDKPMIQHSIESLNLEGNYIFIIRTQHNIDNKLTNLLQKLKPNCKIIEIDKLTQGCTDTCLYAKTYINNNKPLIITNCDQILDWDSNRFLDYLQLNTDIDGTVMTYKSTHPKNSFIKINHNGFATELVEKKVISDIALVGFHYWKCGRDFVWSAEELIKQNIRMNDEYYISITYNLLIKQNKLISTYPLNEDNETYHAIGTPDDMFKYMDEQHNIGFKKFDMTSMHRGWFIGDFLPSAYRTSDFEVGFLKHLKNEKWPVHFHKKAVEINYLISGKMKLNHKIINKGDIFIFDKGEIACPIFLEECDILCVKVPSSIGDKYEI
jgi:dTDP-glucose pyrophosphorylase